MVSTTFRASCMWGNCQTKQNPCIYMYSTLAKKWSTWKSTWKKSAWVCTRYDLKFSQALLESCVIFGSPTVHYLWGLAYCNPLLGVVCVWDLESTCLALPALFSREKGLVIHPMTQLTAHKAPCRTVTWCPHDHNYIFTGQNAMSWYSYAHTCMHWLASNA